MNKRKEQSGWLADRAVAICSIVLTTLTLVIALVALRQSGEVDKRVTPESQHHHHIDESEVPETLLEQYPDAMGNMHVHILKDGTKELHFNGHPPLDHHR